MRRLALLILAAVAVAGCSGGGPPFAQPGSAGAGQSQVAGTPGSGAGNSPDRTGPSLAAPSPATQGTAAPSPGPQGPAAHSTAHTVPGLTARIILSGRAVAAGSSLRGRVVIENRTGRARHVNGCLSLFQVLLTSRRYHPSPVWPDCLQRFTIKEGRSSYKVQVEATYSECTQGPPAGGIPECLPGGRMPPLPPGRYRARLFQSVPLAPAPAPAVVIVTPRPAS